jgi:hypothetical protein
LGIAMAVPASARSPKETESFSDKGFTSRMPNPGYRQPPLFYYRGQTFNVTFTLHNDSVENNNNVAKTACFTLQVFRLPDFDPAIDRHETWLEANRDEHQVLVFDGARETLNFAADETKTLTRGATLTADGYYQFDYGFCSDVPLLPKEGYEGPMVSGFVRVLGAVPATPPPSTPPPAATPAPSGSGVLGAGGAATARASALTLAATGSGAQQQGSVPWLGLLLWMGLLGAAGLGLALRRVR